MKLSWSHKLFLSINKNVGTFPLLDKVMYFCGQWLIVILAVAAGLSLIFEYTKSGNWYIFAVAFVAFLLSYALSYLTAILFHHPRPIKELPNVKELIIPIETWKSFPSDHTIAATLFAFIIFVVFDETRFEVSAFFLSGAAALLVMAGRIYCGVHYPRDILGGIVYACIASLITVLICSRYFFGF